MFKHPHSHIAPEPSSSTDITGQKPTHSLLSTAPSLIISAQAATAGPLWNTSVGGEVRPKGKVTSHQAPPRAGNRQHKSHFFTGRCRAHGYNPRAHPAPEDLPKIPCYRYAGIYSWRSQLVFRLRASSVMPAKQDRLKTNLIPSPKVDHLDWCRC